MITLSHWMSPQTAQTYYLEKWTSLAEGYYSENATLRGHWYGIEAQALGLVGETNTRDFNRIMTGRHPDARFDEHELAPWQREGTVWIIRDKANREQLAEVRLTRDGWMQDQNPEKRYRSAGSARTAAWRALTGQAIYYRDKDKQRRALDIVSRPGKTVSVAAVVGGDKRILEAHRRANAAMLRAIERLIQAHGGGNNPKIATGRFVVARFEHYTARPEEMKLHTGEIILYPAALLHTHNVMANWTRTPDGQIRSIESAELFRFQALGKAVYQAHMARELRELGYQVEIGANGAPEIAGYSKEYLDSESLRSRRIQAELVALGLEGAKAEYIISKVHRNEKLELTEAEVALLHKANDAAHGHQNERIIAEAVERAKTMRQEQAPAITAEQAVTRAKRSLSEQYSVFDHWTLVVKALEYAEGHVLEDAIEHNIAARTQTSEEAERGILAEFMVVDHVREGAPGLRYTTDYQYTLEADLCEVMAQGRNRVRALHSDLQPADIEERLANWQIKPAVSMVRAGRAALETKIAALETKLTAAHGSEDDPYFERWRDTAGLTQVGMSALPRYQGTEHQWKDESAAEWDKVETLGREFPTWREEQVADDTRALVALRAKLDDLDRLETAETRNRLKKKVEIEERFEAAKGIKPNADQVAAVHAVLTSPDRLTGLVGSAGSGKTSALQVIAQYAEEQGFRVVGVAPTAKAVQKLEEKGIHATTLQGFLLANTPEAVVKARETVEKLERSLNKLAGRVIKTRTQRAAALQSFEKATIVLAGARMDYCKAEERATTGKLSRSLQAALRQRERRAYYVARLPILAERIRKTLEWKENAETRIAAMTGRLDMLAQRQETTRERLRRHTQMVFDRGVSLDGTPRLVFADESSLAENRQCAELFGLFPGGQDRVVLVGDPGQHESIGAARAFDLLLQAGMRRGEIYQVVRQKDEKLRNAVEKCTFGKHHKALDVLADSGHVQEIRTRAKRLDFLIDRFREHPDESLLIAPDNRTRLELNDRVREEWKGQGRIAGECLTGIVLVPRQQMTTVDREIASRYEVGYVIRCREGSEAHAMERGSYWHVSGKDGDKNTLNVYRTGPDGAIQARMIDPARFRGALEVYEKQEREFGAGDRILFKRKWAEHGIVNGTAAIVKAIDVDKRSVTVSLVRDGREITWNLPKHELSVMPHVDYGYATTSYSIQGDMSKYVYAHMDTGDPACKRLLSRAMFYVSVSRAEEELQLVTNDAEKLRNILRTGQEKGMALSPQERLAYTPEQYDQARQPGRAIGA